jgi:ligand-binding sensor domain-containing protein
MIVVVLLFITIFKLSSEIRLDNWVAHTSLVNTQALDIDKNGKIWVASSGGIYSIYPDASGYEVFRNINQMLDIEITALKIHPETGEIFTGSKNGLVDIYSRLGHWTHVTDIFNQKFSNPIINDITFHGSKAYIAGGFGLAIYDTELGVFDETVRRFADFNSNSPANRVIINDGNIWIATSNGIAVADINSVLANPANWIGYKSNPGLFEASILDIAIIDDAVYAMSEKFITKLVGNELVEYKKTGDRYTSLYVNKDSELMYSTIFGILDKNDNVIEMQHPAFVNGFLQYDNKGKSGYILLYEKNGIGLFLNNQYSVYLPDSPLSNYSTDLTVDNNGNLWLATDQDPNGRGFAKYDNKKWMNFTDRTYPEINNNQYHKITAVSDGRILASSYGGGLLVIEPDGNNYKFRHFDTSNSVMIGLSVAPTYLVCGKARADASGNIWVPMLGNESSGPSLVGFDSEYKSFAYLNPRNPIQRYFSSLAIDYNGTKWVGGSRVSGLGVLYLNEKGTFEDRTGDISGIITQNDYPNMPDNTHSSIEVDKNGYVWFGTPRGLAVISNPSTVLSQKPSINVRNLNRLIGEQNINCILVDAQNNKWLATNNGIWVINSDGSDTVGTININNSPLPTNEIISLAYNQITGQVYFGSKLGIYEAQSLSVLPSDKYEISCYPQPFNLRTENELVIEGLEEVSDIRIVTVSGDLVRKFFANSKKAIWDGKDENGNLVPPGIYLIMATSSTSKNSAVEKIAVISN